LAGITGDILDLNSELLETFRAIRI